MSRTRSRSHLDKYPKHDVATKLVPNHILLSKEFLVKQFRKGNCCFKYDQPRFIASAQYDRYQKAYVIWRFLFLVYDIFVLAHGILQRSAGKPPYFVIEHHWYQLFRVLSALTILMSAVHLLSGDRDLKTTPFLYKVTWFVYIVTSQMSLSTTFYRFIYKVMKTNDGYSGEEQLPYFAILVLIVVDFVIIGMPVRLLHVYLAPLTSLVYPLFTVFYWCASGRTSKGVIYEILDWQTSPGSATAWLLIRVLLIAPLHHIAMFFMYWIRLLMYKYLFRASKEVDAALSTNSLYAERVTVSTTINVQDIHNVESIDIINMYSRQES